MSAVRFVLYYRITSVIFQLVMQQCGRRDQVIHVALDEPWMLFLEIDKWKREARDMVAVLQKAAQVVQSGNFRRQNQRFSLAVEREVTACAGAVIVRLAQPFNFDFSNGFAHLFGGARLAGAQKYLGGWLREHRFGIVAVAGLHLAAALKAENNRVLRFAVFGDGGVQLR